MQTSPTAAGAGTLSVPGNPNAGASGAVPGSRSADTSSSGSSAIASASGGIAGSAITPVTTNAGAPAAAIAGASVVAGMTGSAAGAAAPGATCAPSAELCDSIDNDCDGKVDEEVTRPCGINQGECKPGPLACHAGKWDDEKTQCQGGTAPQEEECDAARKDENCDGMPNEGCACTEGETMPCGNATPPCRQGTLRCVDGKFSTTCEGEVKGSTEVCDGRDNDCNGSVDEGVKNECGGCTRLASPPGTSCSAGSNSCKAYGRYQCRGQDSTSCDAVALPSSPETCDSTDEDCDGRIDENLKNACGGACDIRLANMPDQPCNLTVPGRPAGCAKQGKYKCESPTSVSCAAEPNAPTVGDCGCQWVCGCKPNATKCTQGETKTIFSDAYPAGMCAADWLCMTREGCTAGPNC